jgi:hypothetical protein
VYNYFYDSYRSNGEKDSNYLEMLHYANQLLEQEVQEDVADEDLMRQGNSLAEILQIFLTRRQDVLQLIETYGVLRPITIEATRIIIQYVFNNANQIPGNIQQKEERLFRQFTNSDMIVIPILRIFRVPDNVINQYIREVIRVTLRNIGTQPQPQPQPEPDPVVRRILRDLETQHPNFFGLTVRYNIPLNAARNISSDIINFTLRNINRIPQTGNFQQRADVMLRLLDSQNPQLIERMISRGVPAGEAETIARQIILFTLRNIGTQPEPDINVRVNMILREFEQQRPNYLGLTTTYRIPVNAARQIVRDIIEFTVINLNRIQQVGTVQQRADAMLRFIDSQNPELIERMIRRGVPAVQAESITRQIILFTLQRVPLPR